ncbi:hypothetical protein CES87_12750 [Pseudomonas sp. ERMR1:02]|nr:NEL-type E3 ubiquitin ligase domain-containing protein [Pseudomonas sp. PCH199]PAM83186.1 hypothetical protein CES87_12750 [Pseudomonas sp. ERMR1:02]
MADARSHAVPTADVDARVRSEKMAELLNIGVLVLTTVSMFVPVMGEVMMAVMAGQMLEESFDGVIEWSEGDRKAAKEHLTDIAENLALLALMAGAGKGLAKLTAVKVEPLIENLRPVTLPNGQKKLWKPDIAPYKATVTLPPEARSDELGLYDYNGQTVLPLDGADYVVKQDAASEQYRIQHPTRPEAYAPELVNNGEGAWHHELERPLTWKGLTLMRRLGRLVDGFSDAQLEQVRTVSGVDDDVLRRLHVEGEKVPAVLLDTLKKFSAYGDAAKVERGIREGSLSSELCGYAASLAVELPGWPASKAIEAFTADGLSGPSVKYGNSDALPKNILKITRSDLMSGRLPENIIASSNEEEVKSLLPHYTPKTTEERITALQKKLEEHAVSARARLTRSLYTEQQPTANAAVVVVQRDFTGLPTAMVEELLADATLAELETLTTAKRVPLRLAEGARRLQQQMRLTHAYEGLYLEALADRDTEILALNSLKALPGWLDDLRLEVRVGDIEGELRASVGPEDATERKVLLRKHDGRYETRSDRDEQLHGTDDLYSSIQHALPDRQRQAIGLPHVSQGEQLRAKIIEHQLPRDQLRPLLKMQPRQQPLFKSPTRLSGERIGYPLSDHPRTTQWQRIVQERVNTLYPLMTLEEIDAFIASMGDRLETILKSRESEFKKLNQTLRRWQRAQLDGVSDEERGTEEFVEQRSARLAIIKALQQAWQRTGEPDLDITDRPQGQYLDLSDMDLLGQLNELPPLTANFDHVTHLNLSGAGIEGNVNGFLRYFRRLHGLNLSNNKLVQLPETLGQMKRLTELDLSDNLIELDAPAVARLRGLERLQFLGLEGNPLGLSPDIGQMPDLNIVMLAHTGLTTWPVGVFEQYRGRTFNLDLGANVLEEIPQVTPGSAEAEVVARTIISHEPRYISDQNLQIVRGYRESVGLEPDRPYPPRGILDSIDWKAGLSDELWQAKQDVWDSLEHEHGSEPFFRELRKLAQSADALATEESARADLCRKVWEMIEAAAEHSALREKLFRMAAAPTTCVDAGAQVFNAMGTEVLLAQAYELASYDLVETALLELARGKSRLDELGRIARERVGALLEEGHLFPEYDEEGLVIPRFDAQGRPVTDIDEVEIHMIYATQLADRLDLPWQSRQMRFQVPDVSTKMIDDAYKRVLEKEQGPLLQARLIEQPFWVDYLKRYHSEPFKTLYAKAELLLDLQDAQQAWVDSDSSVHKIHWRSEVVRLAKLLGKPDSEVMPGMVMSDAQYYAEMDTFETQEKALIGKLTGEAMQRAKLQRDETSFRVQGNTAPRT